MLGCYTIPPTILTPHVLSEWMVEVCRFDKCGVRLGFDLVWCLTLGVIILYITIIHILYYYILYIILYIYILLLYILYYTLLFCSSDLSSFLTIFLLHLSSHPFLPPSHLSPFLCSSSLLPHFILYVSVLTYTYLYSSILQIYLQFCSPLLFLFLFFSSYTILS